MSTSFPPLPPDRPPTKDSVVCRICGKPVSVNTAKADAYGKVIHEECYAAKVQFERASRFEQAGRDALQSANGVSHRGDGHAGDSRPWKLIAEEVIREQDPKKMAELVAELNHTLDEQRIHGAPKPKPDGGKAG